MSKLKIIATINVKPEFKADIFDMLKTVTNASRKEEGNISYILHEDINNSSKVIILEEWKSQEAIDFHNQTDHFLLLKTELGKKADSLMIDIIRESY